jgi:S-disulfanyl-L-cysteine oxidoreductase SoxD
MIRSARRAAAGLAAILASSCVGEPAVESHSAVRPTDPAFAYATAVFAPVSEPPAEFAHTTPERTPARLGLGRSASPAEIARLDRDVRPDGTGLPPGSGTARAGAPLYAAQCAACHGAAGTGGSELALVAPGADKHAFTTGSERNAFATRTIGNYWPYATTIFDYVRRTMPFDRPGSLTDDEVYALTAWLLWRNDIIAQDAVIDASTLPLIEMPALARFQVDDRPLSSRVR